MRQILPSPEVVNDVVLYNVLVDVENKDRELMTGMSTQMFFVVGHAQNVPVLPMGALGRRVPRHDNEKGEAYQVQIVSTSGTDERTVHIGLMDRAKAEIRDGLRLGDRIILQQMPTQQSDRREGSMRGPRL